MYGRGRISGFSIVILTTLRQWCRNEFSLAHVGLVRSMINCCHGNINHLSTCPSISNSIWKKVTSKVCIELEAYQAVIYNKKGDTVTARRHGRLIAEELNASHLLNSSWLSIDDLSNLCQVDGQTNVGEMQLTKFSSNRPVKSTLTTR